MGATRVISIVGKHNSGKTTLLVALAGELVRRGRKVMTLKHGAHPVEVDQPGKDTYRHFHEGRVDRVLLEAPGQRVLFERAPIEADPISLVKRFLTDADVVLVEGFKNHALPKIEVHRKSVHRSPLLDPTAPDAAQWLAILTDDDALRAPCAVFRFTDTMWLMALTAIAWDKAAVIET